jgi:hypothetical protein
MNAVLDAMGALTICLTRQFTPEQRKGFKSDMDRLAVNAGKQDSITLQALLIDLRNAAVD